MGPHTVSLVSHRVFRCRLSGGGSFEKLFLQTGHLTGLNPESSGFPELLETHFTNTVTTWQIYRIFEDFATYGTGERSGRFSPLTAVALQYLIHKLPTYTALQGNWPPDLHNHAPR